MSILGIYLLGVVAAALHLVWFEYQFDHNKRLSNVTLKEWLQDAAISLFSWIAFALAIIVTIGDLMEASPRIVRKERPEYIVFFCHFQLWYGSGSLFMLFRLTEYKEV